MKTKDEILADIAEGLESGVITENDLTGYFKKPAEVRAGSVHEKLGVVDIMFYIAGIVLYSAILSVITQSWDDGSALTHIILSLGVGLGLWSIAYYLIKSAIQSDVRRGLINSLLLTGSLSVVTGGYIVTNELIGGFGEVNFIPGAVMLAVVGALHIAFDRLIKRDLTLLMGVLLLTSSFPAFMFGLLQDADVPLDVWSIILILSAGLLAYATRVVDRITPDSRKVGGAFDTFAALLALAGMYAASFGDFGLLWYLALVASVIGIFYLSIINQNKKLLGTASFFMVLTVITLSFRYFSGYGATTSLILATIGLLGTAAIASSINKKYFK